MGFMGVGRNSQEGDLSMVLFGYIFGKFLARKLLLRESCVEEGNNLNSNKSPK